MHSEDDSPPRHAAARLGDGERPPSGRLPLDDDPTPAAVITAAAVAAAADESTSLVHSPAPQSHPAAAPPPAPVVPVVPVVPPAPAVPIAPAPAAVSAEPVTQLVAPVSAVAASRQPVSTIPGQWPGYIPAQAGPLMPVSGLPYQPMVTPRPRRRWGVVAAFVALAVAMLCVLPTGVLATFLVVSVGGDPAADPVGAAGPTARVPSPGASATLAERQLWIRDQLIQVLARQAAALLAGDEGGYLAAVDPAAAQLRMALARQYQSLRAMRVVAWRDEVRAGDLAEVPGAAGRWKAEVVSFTCFVTTPCADGKAGAQTEWLFADGRVVLMESRPLVADSSPHPWQVSELFAVSGARTVVATTAQYSGQLPTLLEKAEQAARVADQFARAEHVPPRYVLYFAGPAEWRQWFTIDASDWYGGVAVIVSDDRYDLVLNAEASHPTFIDDLMRHELTHASTLAGPLADRIQPWWLVEGIAEFAQMNGAGVNEYDGLESTRKLLDQRPTNDIQVERPAADAPEWEVEGRYGLAFLGVRCIGEFYGQDRLISFFHAVVHDGQPVAAAATAELGAQWSTVNADCDGYIRSAAG